MSRNAQIVLTTLCIGLLAFLSPALLDSLVTLSAETDSTVFSAADTRRCCLTSTVSHPGG